MSCGFSALVLASLTVCIFATENSVASSSGTALLARDHLSPLQWGKRVNRILGLRGHKKHAGSLVSTKPAGSQLELDVPIESMVEKSLEDAGVASRRASTIAAKTSDETKLPVVPSAGGVQMVTASPNPLAGESGSPQMFIPKASPNPLAEASASGGPAASPNVLAEAQSGPTASPNVLAEAQAPNGPTASPNVLAEAPSLSGPTASPNEAPVPSGPTASPNVLAQAPAPMGPTASPNVLAEAAAPTGLTANPNVLVEAAAPTGPTASPNVLAGALAPTRPTASPNVLAGDVVDDKNSRLPLGIAPANTVPAGPSPVTASKDSLASIPNLKSLDSLFGTARAPPPASTESDVAPAVVALAAVKPAAVTPVLTAPVTAPVTVLPAALPMASAKPVPLPNIQAGVPQIIAQQPIAQFTQTSPSLSPPATVGLLKPAGDKVLKLGLKGMAATGGEFTLRVMNQMSEKLRHTPGADVVQYLDELGGLQRGPVSTRNTFWISLARNPCDWYVQLWANYQPADKQALNNRYGGAFFSPGNQDQLKFENWLNWALGDHDDISSDSNGMMSLRYSDTIVAGRRVDWMYNRQHMSEYNSQLLNAYALSRNADPAVERDLQSFSPKSKVDCWITVENYVESLRNCLSQYEAMATVELDWQPFDLLIDKPNKKTGDGVVERDQCEAYFTSELAEKVQHRDRHLFEAFGYDTCCGAPTRPIE